MSYDYMCCCLKVRRIPTLGIDAAILVRYYTDIDGAITKEKWSCDCRPVCRGVRGV